MKTNAVSSKTTVPEHVIPPANINSDPKAVNRLPIDDCRPKENVVDQRRRFSLHKSGADKAKKRRKKGEYDPGRRFGIHEVHDTRDGKLLLRREMRVSEVGWSIERAFLSRFAE